MTTTIAAFVAGAATGVVVILFSIIIAGVILIRKIRN